MSLTHQLSCIWTHRLSNRDVLFADLVYLIAVRPDLIRCTGYTLCATGRAKLWLIRHTVAVQSHNRTERAVLKPADKYLMIGLIINIRSEESADIRCPPRNSRNSHIQSCRKLILETLKCGMNVSGPYECAILLAAGPCAAQKVHDILLTLFLHAVEKRLRVHHRIYISDLYIRSQVIAIVFKIINRVLRLRLIQPENLNTLVVVIFLDLLPYVLTCLRIGRIELDRVAHIGVVDPHTLFHAGQQSLCLHLVKVLALVVYHRPYRYHQLNAHLLELCNHCIRIRPVGRIKSPVALLRPVEEIDHDHIDRNTTTMIFSCHLKQLLLGLIAQLALPESKSVLRHHRHLTGRIRISLFDLCRCIACGDPVVQFLRGLYLPGRDVLIEADSSDRRIVPEEAVTKRGKCKRHTCL